MKVSLMNYIPSRIWDIQIPNYEYTNYICIYYDVIFCNIKNNLFTQTTPFKFTYYQFEQKEVYLIIFASPQNRIRSEFRFARSIKFHQ